MSIRSLAALFFVAYGACLPFAARAFAASNPVTTAAMIVCCLILADLLRSGRAGLLNLLIAIYVFKVYLLRPYVYVLEPFLKPDQLVYVRSVDFFYSPADAVVVYTGLLSILAAWWAGLRVAVPKPASEVSLPSLFLRLDRVVAQGGPPLWVAWGLLIYLNFTPPSAAWRGIATGQSSHQFAWGLFSPTTLIIACVFAAMTPALPNRRGRFLLFIPALYSAALGVVSGSRAAIFSILIVAATYWLFLNRSRSWDRRDLMRLGALVAALPVVVYFGLVAQSLRYGLRAGKGWSTLKVTLAQSMTVSTDNPLYSAAFGVSQLLHRLSNLSAPFLIMNDRWIRDPAAAYTPLTTVMRVLNELVPAGFKPFPELIGINQLFEYLYYDYHVVYSSETWSLQGTLYLYFGRWLSPVAVFLLALWAGRRYRRLEAMAEASPAFAALFIVAFNDLIEPGVLERVIPFDVVRPLASYVAVLFLAWACRLAIEAARRGSLIRGRISVQ